MKFALRPLALAVAVCGLLAAPTWAANKVDPQKEKLKAIPQRMQEFVDRQYVAGAVTLVAQHGKVLALDAVGYSDLKAKRTMRTDDLFWIASMTKPLTGTAILMLQDEGKLSVDDEVEKFLPEFKGQLMLVTKNAEATVLKKPGRRITLRDLLTHTSGLNSDIPETGRDLMLGERTLAYALQPLSFEPGSKWMYSNPGINTLGRIVEVVSGQSFAEFMESRLFKPLGMKDTTFWPTEAQARRVAKAYQPGPDGKGLVEVDNYFLKGLPLTARWRTAIPAGGLYSTAGDMAKFYMMMLNGGEVNGRRYISKSAHQQLTTTQTGAIKTGFTEGMSWGFGFQVVKEPQGVTAMLAPGTYGHGGAYATQSWADPKSGTVYILMIQRAKLPNGDGSEIRKAFQETAAGALK
ncbi:MAG: class A beta-lactamase-related serine hydrolase [Verrucomicrobia bacterium]|nr:class A beta-lactamase-related serine hydrolase [Verrucomicrobiota bacterium]NBU09634.1 class A beta-lactamase-related serine hydrolase [Pseudomonadota bacterium]NDA66152.1 class A beta-lactamase-related serine hydrolase [Verrucomicrobiota bacterium]NDB74856.1 class A beta-lactamase-related serine hydrolase [Verrucomicrobiota bacterium]NDD37949.1 class A beta-lactamase-related serine hydrolase [Verrucomicrobiota bacterium]